MHVKKIEKLETVTQLTWKPDYTLKTDVDNIKINKTHARIQTVVDMLKTSILLASINTNTTTYEDTTSDIQNVTWDYWNNPVMDWLAKSSQIVTSFTTDMQSNYLPYYLETTVHNMKQIELEDQIHKATKTRIQDQLESSWHVEWIESLKLGIYTK